MTCKDCLGYKFCSRGRNGQTNFYGEVSACNNVESLCKDFKNKADFVEVVRCKDCRYFNQKVPCGGFCICGEVTGGIPRVRVNEDFCSYGERRDT